MEVILRVLLEELFPLLVPPIGVLYFKTKFYILKIDIIFMIFAQKCQFRFKKVLTFLGIEPS